MPDLPEDPSQDRPPEIAVRIPGTWSCPASLEKSLPGGFTLTPGWLRLPDGARLQVYPHGPDDEFAGIFMAPDEQKTRPQVAASPAAPPSPPRSPEPVPEAQEPESDAAAVEGEAPESESGTPTDEG